MKKIAPLLAVLTAALGLVASAAASAPPHLTRSVGQAPPGAQFSCSPDG